MTRWPDGASRPTATAAPMNHRRTACAAASVAQLKDTVLATALAAVLGLGACGGKGDALPNPGGGGTQPPPSVAPTYRGAPGLLWIDPSRPEVAYNLSGQVFSADVIASRGPLLSSGTISTGTGTGTSARQVTALRPDTLLYIDQGRLRSLSMRVDTGAPVATPAAVSNALYCGFGLAANDYARPLNSRVVGKLCNNGGTDELRLGSTGVQRAGRLTADPIGVLRDPVNLAPRAWIYTDSIVLWNAGTGTSVALSPANSVGNAVILSTDRSAVMRRAGTLSVLDFTGGAAYAETLLGAVTSLPNGSEWTPIGFDAEAYFFRADSLNETSNTVRWTVLKITRSNPTASVLATGTGSDRFTDAAMGRGLLYLTGLDASATGDTPRFRIVRINKASGAVAQTVYPPFVRPSLTTSPTGVHKLLQSESSNAFPNPLRPRTTLQFIDENGSVLYAAEGGRPVSTAAADMLRLDSSSNATRFVFAACSPLAAGTYSGAALISYDTDTRLATTLGNLASLSRIGNDFDLRVAVTSSPGSTGVGVTDSVYSGTGTPPNGTPPQAFSFDLNTANSLRYVTTVR